KLDIIAYYERNKNEMSIKAISKVFNIQPRQLHKWITKKDELNTSSLKAFKLHNGKQPSYLQIETTLF
ncbi:2824_t:CDS:1, partial [Racocetra fulgida]